MIGWTPAEVDACGYWEFLAACEGYRRAHGAKDAPGGDIEEGRLREMGIEGF